MGRGKKRKDGLALKGKSESSSVNCSAPARNLCKKDLCAVILGCTRKTMDECLQRKLFGLPAQHFSYIKNIRPGLPLFLFNYSDRKLHGVFEAASAGQMNINAYAWTEDGTDQTPFPAQVRVHVRTQCSPLPEKDFKPIISNNYFERHCFYNELDHEQTDKLMMLFSSVPVTRDTKRIVLDAPPRETCFLEPSLVVKVASGNPPKLSYPVVSNNSASFPERKWSALFQTSSASEPSKEDSIHQLEDQRDMMFAGDWDEDSDTIQENDSYVEKANSSQANNLDVAQFAAEGEYIKSISFTERKWSSLFQTSYASEPTKGDSIHQLEAQEEMPVRNWHEGSDMFQANLSYVERADSVQANKSDVTEFAATTREEECILGSDTNLLHSDKSCSLLQSDEESQSSETSSDDAGNQISNSLMDEPEGQKTGNNFSHSSNLDENNQEGPSFFLGNLEFSENHDKDPSLHFLTTDTQLEERCSSDSDMITKMKFCNLESPVIKLMEEIERLKGSQLKQILKISSLERDLVESKIEIQRLKMWCSVLESGPCISRSKIDNSVLIVGGFDGSSWLPTLDAYYPYHDKKRSVSLMPSVRGYASAATSNGELYLLGGVNGDVDSDTVELFSLGSNQWRTGPPLKQKKRSLAGISLFDKIFAIGGANKTQCFSEMEVLDTNIGMWIQAPSMQYKRFAPAAAQLHNVLYVVGGYDGNNYLKSLERFDPRECAWTELRSMTTRRGCHSLVALNEKLYSLGGYDGEKFVPFVEVFDPRNGSWMIGESMHASRGNAGTFIFEEKIYIVGGLTENAQILDTVECYKEGSSWELTNLKAVGKRCYFSAIVL